MRSQFILAGLVLVLTAMFCGYSWMSLNKQTKTLMAKKADSNAELKKLKDLVKEVEGYEANKKNLEEKNRIIEQLKKNQSGPVHLLDELSGSLEKLKLWLTKLEVKGNAVELDGKALTNSDIVEFINKLKASKFFKDIRLIESKQVKEQGIAIYSFHIKSTLVL